MQELARHEATEGFLGIHELLPHTGEFFLQPVDLGLQRSQPAVRDRVFVQLPRFPENGGIDSTFDASGQSTRLAMASARLSAR
jgi:hypothetical protein